MGNYSPLILLYILCFSLPISAQPTPPQGKKWKKIEVLSDEFNGNALNFNKWDDQSPQWKGRVPGIFKENTIKVQDGSLQITNYKLDQPEGAYTHAGGLVRSLNRQTYGYFECRMKASKTFMSSTFWLINKRNEFTGCDYRTTELDVTENVGVNSGGQDWINANISSLNSNTHSRNVVCDVPAGIRGNKAPIGAPAWQNYHTYGVWWKSKTELLFYLDGVFKFQITPAADFDLPMYLRMVTETYDWNPVPPDGGMTGSATSRTTYYDWVRSYELVDDDSNPAVDTVAFTNAPTTIAPATSYTFTVDYEASTDREIVVEFWSATNWIAQQKETVEAGSASKTITVTLPGLPDVGTGYVYKTHIRPIGTNWQAALDRDQINNITINPTLAVDDKEISRFSIYPNPSSGKISIQQTDLGKSVLTVYNVSGHKVFSTNTKKTIDLSGLSSGMYIVQFFQNGLTTAKTLLLQ